MSKQTPRSSLNFLLATIERNQYLYARCTEKMYSLRHANMNSHPQTILMNSYQITRRERSGPARLAALFVMLATMVGLTSMVSAQGLDNAGVTKPTILTETCVNGSLDPGEEVTLRFSVKNTSGGSLNGVKVQLKSEANKVTFIMPSGQVTIGTLAKDATGTADIKFVVGSSVNCGDVVTLKLDVVRDGGNVQELTYTTDPTGTVLDTPHITSNSASIEIKDSVTPPTKANPFPSEINVQNVSGTVSKVEVALTGLTHQYSGDMDIMLIGPGGQKVVLMSDSSQANLSGVNLTFKDSGSALPPEASNFDIPSGNYKPSDYGVLADFTGTGVDSIGAVTSLNTAFANQNPNGVWKLYIVDDAQEIAGSVIGGWSINVITSARECCKTGQPTIGKNDKGEPIDNLTGGSSLTEDSGDITVNYYVDIVGSNTADLTVVAFTSDESIVPAGNLKPNVDDGDGNSRTRRLTFKPAANANGLVSISLRVLAPSTGLTATAAFSVNFNSVNDAPTSSTIPNQSFNVGATQTPPIAFTVDDVESNDSDVIVEATSSNQNVVPNGNIFLTGAGTPSRTIQIFPSNSSNTEATITIRTIDPVNSSLFAEKSFIIDFNVAAGLPTVNPIGNVTMNENSSATANFVVGDSSTPVNEIQVTFGSSNTSIIPNSNLVLGGSGANRSVTITPLTNKETETSGVPVTVTVTAKNNNNQTFARTFTVTINEINSAPRILTGSTPGIPNQSLNEDASNPLVVSVNVDDVETTSQANLVLSVVSSSDASVVPLGGIVVGPVAPSTAARTITITPLPNAFGRTIVTVRLTDTIVNGEPAKTTDDSFEVLVVPVNDKPIFGDITHTAGSMTLTAGPLTDANPLLIDEDAGNQTLSIVGIDVSNVIPQNETGQSLSVSAKSSDTSILPDPTSTYTSPNSTATLTLKPVANSFGVVTVTVTVKDNGGGADTTTRTFKVNVNSVNDAPTLAMINDTTQFKNNGFSIGVSAGDRETAVANLTVTATSSDQLIVQNANIFVAPTGQATGPTHIVTIVPVTDAFGVVNITVSVEDGGNPGGSGKLTATDTFAVTVLNQVPNVAPTIMKVGGDITMDEDTIRSFTVTVSDPETVDPATLIVTASSNSSAIQLIVNPPSGGNRLIAIIPANNFSGIATITVSVRDLDLNVPRSSSLTFNLNVVGIDDQPTITRVDAEAQSTSEDTARTGLKFDAQDPEGAVTFNISSSDETLLPKSGITITGPDANNRYTLSASPASNRFGVSTITIEAQDTAGLKTQPDLTFILTVDSKNDAPTLDNLDNKNYSQDAAAQVVTATGISVGGGTLEASEDLFVTILSNNDSLILDPIGTERILTAGEKTDGKVQFTLTPQAGKFGTATIEVKIRDSGGTSGGGADTIKKTFTVSVGQVNATPTIAGSGTDGALPDVAVSQGATSVLTTFTVADAETPGALLQVTSNVTGGTNPGLVPANGVTVGGSGSNRSVRVDLAANQFGTAVITVTVVDTGRSDGSDVRQSQRSFTVTVNQVQQAPKIVSITPSTLNTDINIESQIATVVISDQETPASGLSLTVDSNTNPTLVKSIQFLSTGDGSSRLMIVIPATGQTGTATITLRVTDVTSGGNKSSTKSFVFNVLVPNVKPTITGIGNQTTTDGQLVGPLSFTVNDVETTPAFLSVIASSSNQSLLPDANIAIESPITPGSGLTGGARRITLIPVAGQTGTSTITLTVYDDVVGGAGTKSAATTFTVSVTGQVNIAPVISEIPDVTTQENVATAQQSFTLTDEDGTPTFVTLTYSSSNPSLVNSTTGVLLGGTGANRTIIVVPTQGQSGTATIIITATDNGSPVGVDTEEFLVTVLPTASVENDFNGDGKSDIVLQDDAGFIAIWYMDGKNLINATLTTPNNVGDPAFRVVAVADFNGDSNPDLVLQHSSGTIAIWYMNGSTSTSQVLASPSNPGTGWGIVDAKDFDGNGKPDFLFQHTDGTLAVWYLNGVTLVSPALLSPSNPGPGWKAVAAGDFNSDGNPDIVFNHTDTSVAVWRMNGISLNSPSLFNPPSSGSWKVKAASDLNNDGQIDLILQNADDAMLGAWFMSGIDLLTPTLLDPPTAGGGNWQIVGP